MQMDEYFSELMLFGGPIGINLRSCLGGKGAYVDSFYKEPFGGVKIGDILWQINDIYLHDISIEEIRQMVKNSTGPMKLIFKSFPPLILSDESENSENNGDSDMKERLESAALHLLHDLRGRSWIKRVIKQSYPEYAYKYAKFTILYDTYQLLKELLAVFPEDELCNIEMTPYFAALFSYAKLELPVISAASLLHSQIIKMLNGMVVKEIAIDGELDNSSKASSIHPSSCERPTATNMDNDDINRLQLLVDQLETDYKDLVSKDIIPVLQDILRSEHPSLLKYRAYLYYQFQGLTLNNDKASSVALFPFLSMTDLIESQSGEIIVLTLFLLSIKKFECAELIHQMLYHRQNGNKVEYNRSRIAIMIMLVRDKLLAKFYESDHYSRLISHGQLNYCCEDDESDRDLDCTVADKEETFATQRGDVNIEDASVPFRASYLPSIRSNAQLLAVNLNLLLSDIGISSCSSIHRPRENDFDCGGANASAATHILLCMKGNIRCDYVRTVLEGLDSEIWSSVDNVCYDDLNSTHLTRFIFPQLPMVGVLDSLDNAPIDVPTNFVLQNFHLPSTKDCLSFDKKLYFGCSVIVMDDNIRESLKMNNRFSMHSPERVVVPEGSTIGKRGHRASFSDTDLIQVAIAQASSLKSFASKVVSGATIYLPSLGSTSQDPVEIEMDEYSRSYISYDHPQESAQSQSCHVEQTTLTTSDTTWTMVSDLELELKSSKGNPMREQATTSTTSVPIYGFCLLSENECFLSQRQQISTLWYKYHNSIRDNQDLMQNTAKIGNLLDECLQSFNFGLEENKEKEFGFSFISESLSPQMVIIAFFAFLMEIKILLVSEEASVSSHVIVGEWLKQVIKPFQYHQIYAPILGPDVAQQVITCPAPYFAGVSLQTFEALRESIHHMDLVILNLSDNSIIFPDMNNNTELMLLKDIHDLLKPGNPLFDVIQNEMKRTASLLARPLKMDCSKTNDEKLSSICDIDQMREAFPGSVIHLSDELENIGDYNISQLNRVIHELIFGLEYCILHCTGSSGNGIVVEEKLCAQPPVILNESLFMKLKRVQMNNPANENRLLLGPALGKSREGLIKTILRSQAWSNYIAQPHLTR